MSSDMDLQSSCDRVAEQYVGRFRDEIKGKPFDKSVLDCLAEKVDGGGVICDLGCGAGQVARYLHSRGLEVCGIDLSAEMLRHAQLWNPDIPFQRGDMKALTEIADETFGGIVAFYSIVHVPRIEVISTLLELKRVLCSNGVLLLAFYAGQGAVHVNELLGEKVSVRFVLFEPEEMQEYLRVAGFRLEEVLERNVPADSGYQGRHVYIFARKK